VKKDIPKVIASPLPRLKRGLEFIKGESGRLIGSNPGESILGKMCVIDELEAKMFAGNYSARWRDRFVETNTYYNKVLEQAVKRGIIELDNKDEGLDVLGGVMGLKFTDAMKDIGKMGLIY